MPLLSLLLWHDIDALYYDLKSLLSIRPKIGQAISSASLWGQHTDRNTTNHLRQRSRSICVLVSVPITLSAIPQPSWFLQCHVTIRVTLHCWKTLSKNSFWAQDHLSPLTILPGPLQRLSDPHGSTEPEITGHISTSIWIPEQAQTLLQQLLDLSETQIEFWKVLRRCSWHTLFHLQWYEHRRSQTRIRVPGKVWLTELSFRCPSNTQTYSAVLRTHCNMYI